jgi:type IV secretory pathway component VirB8
MEFTATFNANLTGYTLSSQIINEATQANVAAPTITSTTATSNNVTTTTVKFSWTETQTGALSVTTRYRWYFRWVTPAGFTRTVLSGSVRPFNP